MSDHKITGVFSAAATPLNADNSPDLGLFTVHCRRLLQEGCHGVALLGTTGEANSFSSGERRAILEAALKAGVPADKLLPGTGVVAIPETVELTKHALSLGVTKVVMLPPFYYKGVSDDGLFVAYSQVLEKVADNRLQVILYHIPQVSGVPLSIPLIGKLIEAFPDTVVGIKESAGDFNNMQAIIAAYPGFSVLAGADPLLLPLLKAGGAGCITATSISSRTRCAPSTIRCTTRRTLARSRSLRLASMPTERFPIPMCKSRRSRPWSASRPAMIHGGARARR